MSTAGPVPVGIRWCTPSSWPTRWPRLRAPGPATGPIVDAFARSLSELGLTPADFDELRVLVAQRLGEVEQRFN